MIQSPKYQKEGDLLMPKIYILVLFTMLFCLVFSTNPQTVAAQDKPVPETKEKRQECDDDDDDEDITDADKLSIKLSLADARKIALERVPGKIVDAELEKENGRLQYAFEICTAEGKCFDVEIDAITGEILKVEDEDDDDDDDEPKAQVVKKVTVVKTAKLAKTKPQ